ncbi:transglutaminase family protein [Kaarinaea lacus]
MEHSVFKQILNAQDERIRTLGVDVWVGMEPTFTRRFAETPEWLSEALGPEKQAYAYQLLTEISQRHPGGVVLHTLGRQYAGEDKPRWSVGYYAARQQQFTWKGPADPFLVSPEKNPPPETPVNIRAFWQALHTALQRNGWQSTTFSTKGNLKYRLLFRCDDKPALADIQAKPQLARSSVHDHKIPLEGLIDALAQAGDFLISLDTLSINPEHAAGKCLVIELPALPTVTLFVQLLEAITHAASEANVPFLMLQGFPPPVDASVAWTTITPDPAVIEVNQAPDKDSAHFYERSELIYSAARTVELYPCRLHYNGVVSDSGGGGQFTLGGTEPLSSPFFRYPHLLPRLIRYLNAHPALSYWFAPPSIGSSSQSPRVDEGLRESFTELAIALEQLEKSESPSADFIWRTLSPFLVDSSGNPHRSELNIEKLWNPYLPGRGCLGLVEFRAFRMSRSPECATAIAVLLRSIVAMLSREDRVSQLQNHGSALHNKYALPFYMQQDLQSVFQDLAQAQLPLHETIQSLLLQEPVRFIGKAEFHDCYIELQQALEFWPLVGDVASQEGGGSRLVDASTTRLQITIGTESRNPTQLDGWEVRVDGYRVPLRVEQDPPDLIKVTGVRYRHFEPTIGLHPGIAARNNISFVLTHPNREKALEVTYHEWQPQDLPYPGLPADMEEATRRRNERFTTRVFPVSEYSQPQNPPDTAIDDYCLDLRRLMINSE